MQKQGLVFAGAGLVAVGLMVGLLIGSYGARGGFEPKPGPQAGAVKRSVFPALGRSGIVGKWEFNATMQDDPRLIVISAEILADGTFIRTMSLTGKSNAPAPIQSARNVGSWKEIEGNRLLISYQDGPQGVLYSYEIRGNQLKVDGTEPQGGPYIDGLYNKVQ